MRRRHGPTGGRSISVGSRGAFRGEPTTPAYGGSKAGLHAMTQSLAVALAPHGIVAAAMAPGFVETDMAQHILPRRGRRYGAQSPLNRVATPAEVAAAVGWLATRCADLGHRRRLDANGASYLR